MVWPPRKRSDFDHYRFYYEKLRTRFGLAVENLLVRLNHRSVLLVLEHRKAFVLFLNNFLQMNSDMTVLQKAH